MVMRKITEPESLEIIHVALSPIIDFPEASDHPNFPGQPIEWKEILEKTPVTKKAIRRNVRNAAAALKPGHYKGSFDQIEFNAHIDGNDSDTVGNFSSFLVGNMAIEES